MSRHASPLAVHETGPHEGRVIVLVHGTMDRSAGFARVSKRLDSRYRVVRYDRRGYGRSVHHPGPFTIEDQIDDLVHLIGEREVAVVGHSMGGNIALGAADRLGPQVRGVAVYESPLSWLPWWPGNSATAQVAADGQDPADVAEGFMRRMIGHRHWERLPASTREARRAEGPALLGEITTLRRSAPWSPERLVVPVYAGRGSEGRDHHQRGMEVLVDMVADGTLVTLEGCGHLAHVAQSEQFVDELIAPLLDRLDW